MKADRMRLRKMGAHPLFLAGERIRMSIVPMFLCVFIPWGLYVLVSSVTTFCYVYTRPLPAGATLVSVFLFCVALLVIAIRARKEDPCPTWYSYLALSCCSFCIVAALLGHSTCQAGVRPWMELTALAPRFGINAGREFGQNFMDAGIIEFAPGNSIDAFKAWSFKRGGDNLDAMTSSVQPGSVYCVAPIVTNNLPPETQSYDFWVVGKDCCSVGTADFRCGVWFGLGNRSGLRVLVDEDLDYYRLAVQQAEGNFHMRARHPIFFTWSEDPLRTLAIENRRVFVGYVFGVAVAFVTALFGVCMAVAKFAWIGRGPWKKTQYGIDEEAHLMRQMQGQGGHAAHYG